MLLVVIDALSSDVVRPAMEEGRLPTLRKFIEAGQVNWQCTSVFPSITPAATASIATGQYPSDHNVMGAYYYDREKDEVRFFGADIWVIWNRRFHDYMEDFVEKLNDQCLSAPTIFQQLEDQSRSCASINYLIFAASHQHKVHTPWLLRLWPGMPHLMDVKGPETLCLGDFVSEAVRGSSKLRLNADGGIFNRYGFCDKSTGQFLQQLATHGLPEFTLAYFPDNDFDSHSKGPAKALESVQAVDRCLAKVANTWGGVEGMLDYLNVVVVGDHSQCELDADQEKQGIDLNQQLHGFNLVQAGTPWEDGEALMVCPNLRVAQIYLHDDYKNHHPQIIERLLQEPRVDQVFDREYHDDSQHRFFVHTADRGSLEFWTATENNWQAADSFGGLWNYHGELSAVDARLDGGKLRYNDYPNALERIAHSFERRYSGDLWVTARPGYEFCLPKTKVHNSGSHGSLHRLDSTAPLIVSSRDQSLPGDEVRIVDVAPLCMSLLGERSSRSVGQSHTASFMTSETRQT